MNILINMCKINRKSIKNYVPKCSEEITEFLKTQFNSIQSELKKIGSVQNENSIESITLICDLNWYIRPTTPTTIKSISNIYLLLFAGVINMVLTTSLSAGFPEFISMNFVELVSTLLDFMIKVFRLFTQLFIVSDLIIYIYILWKMNYSVTNFKIFHNFPRKKLLL